MGHTRPETTQRYAHVQDEALRQAANQFPARVRCRDTAIPVVPGGVFTLQTKLAANCRPSLPLDTSTPYLCPQKVFPWASAPFQLDLQVRELVETNSPIVVQ